MILRKLNFEDNRVVVDDGGLLECKVRLMDSLSKVVLLTEDLRSSWRRLIIFRVFGRVQVGTGRFRYIS